MGDKRETKEGYVYNWIMNVYILTGGKGFGRKKGD